MDARSIIARLRRREVPTGDELRWFAQGLADQGVSDAQAGAFAMAVCMGSLGTEGRAALTLAMRDSGRVLEWKLDGPVLDKHSTGGVGDCVSLLLAPALPKASYAHASIPNLRAKMLEYYDLASSLATSRAKMLEYYDLASSLATSPLQWRGLGTLQSTLSRYADAVRG